MRLSVASFLGPTEALLWRLGHWHIGWHWEILVEDLIRPTTLHDWII